MYCATVLSIRTMGSVWKHLGMGFVVMISLTGALCSEAMIFSYMLGFMENVSSKNNTELQIIITNTGRTSAALTLTLHSGQIENGLLEANSYRIQYISTALLNIESKKSSKGIRVDSNETVNVIGINRVTDSRNSMDGFVGIEYSSIGRDYYAATANTSSEILIIGTANNTYVTIQLRAANGLIRYEGETYRNTDIIHEFVDEFDTIHIWCNGDLTGTAITATHPVSVFSGNKWFSFSRGTSEGSYLVEELPPLENWSTRYVIEPPERFGFICIIVAGFDDTDVHFNCSGENIDSVHFNKSGDSYTLDEVVNACVITASKPFLVSMITSQKAEKDPSMIIVQPMNSLHEDTVFYVPNGFPSAELVLITTDNPALLYIDAQSIGSDFLSFDASLFGVRVAVDEGIHVLIASTSSIAVSGYLHGTRAMAHGFEAFGYPLMSYNYRYQRTSTVSPPSPPSTCDSCVCYMYTNVTTEQLADLLQELRQELLVQQNKTNRYLRSKISASDERTSSAAFGFVASIILATLGACVLAIDIGRFLAVSKQTQRKICKC